MFSCKWTVSVRLFSRVCICTLNAATWTWLLSFQVFEHSSTQCFSYRLCSIGYVWQLENTLSYRWYHRDNNTHDRRREVHGDQVRQSCLLTYIWKVCCRLLDWGKHCTRLIVHWRGWLGAGPEPMWCRYQVYDLSVLALRVRTGLLHLSCFH